MKTLKTHQTLLIITTCALLLLGLIALLFFTPFIHAAFNSYWFLLVSALLLMLSPFGRIRLAASNDTEPQYTFWRWLSRIVILELSIIAIFYGICHLSGYALPVYTTQHSSLFRNSLYYSLIHLGLFPFTAFALMACAFGYLSYCCKKDGYISATLTSVIKTEVDDPLGLIVNTSGRAATMFALSSTLTFMSLLLLNAITPHKLLVSFTGFNLIPLITVFILVALIFNKKFNHQIYTLNTKKQIQPRIIIFCFTILLSIALLILILFFSGHSNIVLKTPILIKSLLKNGWNTVWQIFASLWWLSWAPIAGIVIAKISRGYKIREVFLATLALPFLMSLILFLLQTTHFTIHSYRIFNVIGIIIPIIGFLCILVFGASKKSFSMAMQTYLPKLDQIKYRSQDRFIRKILQFSALMLYCYLASGITILCILFFIFILPVFLVLLLLPFTLIKTFWHNRRYHRKIHANTKTNIRRSSPRYLGRAHLRPSSRKLR